MIRSLLSNSMRFRRSRFPLWNRTTVRHVRLSVREQTIHPGSSACLPTPLAPWLEPPIFGSTCSTCRVKTHCAGRWWSSEFPWASRTLIDETAKVPVAGMEVVASLVSRIRE
jgi:hypothetical protein